MMKMFTRVLGAGTLTLVAATSMCDSSDTGTSQGDMTASADLAMAADLLPAPDLMPIVPTLTAISPAIGSSAGGDVLTLTGTDFESGAKVSIAGVAATNVSFTSATGLKATTPAKLGACGPVAVEVTNPVSGQKVTRSDLFSYSIPTANVSFAALSPAAPKLAQQLFAHAIGDFNGDKKPDIAVTLGSGNVGVLLANANGGFDTPASTGTTATTPRGIAIADFDGDGKLDVAVANNGSSSVTIALGDAKGGLAGANYPLPTGGMSPRALVAYDLTGDGRPELITANENSTNISVLVNDGKGKFNTAANSNIAAGTAAPYAVAIADLNGDGLADFMVMHDGTNGGITPLINDGKGSAKAGTFINTGKFPRGIVVGDFTGDKSPDVVVANSNDNNVKLYKNDTKGVFTFVKTFTVGTEPYAVAMADFNCDGRLDVVSANRSGKNVSVLLGDGQGDFPTVKTLTTANVSEPYWADVADLNGDGRPDIVIGDNNTNATSTLWVYLNDSK